MECFFGIKTHTALSMIVKIGDFERFEKAPKFAGLRQRQQGCPAEVIAYADKANERLRRRFYKMTPGKGVKRNVTATAIAWELASVVVLSVYINDILP